MIPLRDNIPSKTFPIVNWVIIFANFYFFFGELHAQQAHQLEALINRWAVVPTHLFSDPHKYGLTLLTAAFLHGGWFHIISNMLFLYIFGDNVEDRMGHFKYVVFYLLAAVLANGSQAYFMPKSSVPLIGASGAIAGVLGAYFFFYPHAKIDTLIPIFFFITIRPIPAFFFLGYWFLIQAISSTSTFSSMASQNSVGGVAFLAHAAGFVVGILMGPMFGKRIGRFR